METSVLTETTEAVHSWSGVAVKGSWWSWHSPSGAYWLISAKPQGEDSDSLLVPTKRLLKLTKVVTRIIWQETNPIDSQRFKLKFEKKARSYLNKTGCYVGKPGMTTSLQCKQWKKRDLVNFRRQKQGIEWETIRCILRYHILQQEVAKDTTGTFHCWDKVMRGASGLSPTFGIHNCPTEKGYFSYLKEKT